MMVQPKSLVEVINQGSCDDMRARATGDDFKVYDATPQKKFHGNLTSNVSTLKKPKKNYESTEEKISVNENGDVSNDNVLPKSLIEPPSQDTAQLEDSSRQTQEHIKSIKQDFFGDKINEFNNNRLKQFQHANGVSH